MGHQTMMKMMPAMNVSSSLGNAPIACSICQLPESDLRLIGCGCTFHTTCAPLSLILDQKSIQNASSLASNDNNKKIDLLPVEPRKDPSVTCPCCSSAVQGIKVLPLRFEPLNTAIRLRAAAAAATVASNKTKDNPKKRSSEQRASPEELEIEATYAVYSQGKESFSTSAGDTESHRTGRWNDEEKEYVDQLVKSFDEGNLPIPHGLKLSPFLTDAILCKASRLTKKMKKARLSTRTFDLRIPKNAQESPTSPPATSLYELQERFVLTLSAEFLRLEYRFFLAKNWRTWFSDLCIQIGYPYLDGSAFLASLDEYERLACNAEEGMRSVRRRRLGLCMGNHSEERPTMVTSYSQVPEGFSGVEFADEMLNQADSDNYLLLEETREVIPGNGDCGKLEDMEEQTATSNCQAVDVQQNSTVVPDVPNASLDDIDQSFMDWMAPAKDMDANGNKLISSTLYPTQEHKGPFLEIIKALLEEWDLPFQHADVWAPTYKNGADDQANKDVYLVHAGDATRTDLGDSYRSAFENFGQYSKSFTFAPGKGLVGRVYSSGQRQWEFGINNLDPDFFLRAGGAEDCGVRSAVGIPLSAPGAGRLVVVLYSCHEVPQDESMVNKLALELERYKPEPKWQLVILGNRPEISGAKETNFAGFKRVTTPTVGISDARHVDASPIHAEGSDALEREMISMLGDHLADLRSDSSHSAQGHELVHQLMTLRLLLLRPTNRRSPDENELVDILKRSYTSYSLSSKGTTGIQSEKPPAVAALLAREWGCLSEARTSPVVGQGMYNGALATIKPFPVHPSAVPPPWSSLFKKHDRVDRHRSHEMEPVMPPLVSSTSSRQGEGAGPPELVGPFSGGFSSFMSREDGTGVIHDHSLVLRSGVGMQPVVPPSHVSDSSGDEGQSNGSSYNNRGSIPRTISCSGK